MDLDLLFEISNNLIKRTKTDFYRYLYEQINWNNRLNVVTGPRGVGKTTMILQHIKNNYPNLDEALYISVDTSIVGKEGLLNIAIQFEKMGGKFLALDEIHKYQNWKQEVKNIYDSLPGLKVVLSGSSSIDIVKGQYDLSRRAVNYQLKGLSLREYVNLKYDLDISVYKFNDIVNNSKIANKITNDLNKRGKRILPQFKRYTKKGYYPFFWEGEDSYYTKLNNSISKIIYEDIPSNFSVSRESIIHMQKMLYMVASSVPYSPNITSISSDLGISRDAVYLYLDYLEKAGLFNFIYQSTEGRTMVRKPEKIYLENPNIFYAIGAEKGFSTSVGSTREAFFVTQIKGIATIRSPKVGDFIVDEKYTFEVGGSGKSSSQIEGVKNAFIVKDNTELGYGNTLPLWVFGFLY